MAGQPILVATKLAIPIARQRERLVPRPRLEARLAKGLERPLTLISAPAGYGKTTLLSQWHAGPGCDYPLAWLSLDSGDNDPVRFLNYLAAALGTLQPGLTANTLHLLQSPRAPAEAALAALVGDLGGFRREFALALDDYHVITTVGIHAAVTYLLDHLPPRLHLVVLTRSDPPLPLALLRARDQLTEIRAEHLRFTPEEADRFLQQAAGVGLSAEDTQALEARTEGWTVGLQMAALSLQDVADPHAFIAAFRGDDRHVADFLLEEVL